MEEVIVLRYGHRIVRDYRVTTHCGLVARAFGAKRIIIQGAEDESIIDGISRIRDKWGGKFAVEFVDSWRKVVKKYQKQGYLAVHATMYGEPLQKKIGKIRGNKVLLILGSQKVVKEVYELADFNISVTTQPHSEIAALAVFLHEYFQGNELELKFKGAKVEIVPEKKGKRVIKS
ncbi:MAG: tRNA (cytidine(56)-2'-O)-methyltransferase [Candidatus Diapherotrites archaeon]